MKGPNYKFSSILAKKKQTFERHPLLEFQTIPELTSTVLFTILKCKNERKQKSYDNEVAYNATTVYYLYPRQQFLMGVTHSLP